MVRRFFGFLGGLLKKRTLAEDIPVAAASIAKALDSSGYRADFSPGSIAEVERFFVEHTQDGRPLAGGLLSERLGQRLFSLGCYCGEVLRLQHGGAWETDDADPEGEINVALRLDGDVLCWPVQRMMKRLLSSEDDLVAWAWAMKPEPALD